MTKEEEQKYRDDIYQVENELDQLIKSLYENRLKKREIITNMYAEQNPNLDETQKRISKKKKKQ